MALFLIFILAAGSTATEPTPFETITQRYKGKFITTDLTEKATELLLLVRDKKKYKRFRIDSEGQKTELVTMQ